MPTNDPHKPEFKLGEILDPLTGFEPVIYKVTFPPYIKNLMKADLPYIKTDLSTVGSGYPPGAYSIVI